MNSLRLFVLPFNIGFFVALSQLIRVQQISPPLPAPTRSTSDGTATDQAIAYVLLFVALAITYLVH
ncbi:hypothetical protein NMG60_11013386 [Bertholletia excelsa]